MIVVQVPVLAYKDEKTQQPHSIYESLICNEFLEVSLLNPSILITTMSPTGKPAKQVDGHIHAMHFEMDQPRGCIYMEDKVSVRDDA